MEVDALLAVADRCVKCGLCLPSCPTYGLLRTEAESPRGRIALIQGLLEGALAEEAVLRGHLDHCLLCRNCERACPSGVEFGALMDGARERFAEGTKPDPRLAALTHPWRVGRLADAARLLKGLRLTGLVPQAYRRSLDWLSPRPVVASPRRTTPRTSTGTRRVALFTGCVSRVADEAAIAAASRVLETLGFAVEVPTDQGCCGALHLHDGFAERADEQVAHNRAVFKRLDVEAVVTVASGCGGHLGEHGGLGIPVFDVSAFLAGVDWPEDLFQALPEQTVALHQPCTLRNVLRQDKAVSALLGRFPALRVVTLESGGCCGAAGMHMLREPAMASRLAEPTIERLRQCGAAVLLTSNTGCALHLASEAREAGLSVEVRHPVEFIAGQLGI